jgi:predicted phage tail protein
VLRDIHLHGALGRRFGRRHRLAVATPAEAVRALCSQHAGFRDAISVGQWRIVRGGRSHGQALALDELGFRLGRAPLHIVPVAAGAGGRGGKALLGIALVGVAFAFAFAAPLGAAAGSTAGFLGGNWGAAVVPGILSAGGVAQLGVAVTLAGVAGLLSPQPRAANFGSTERAESYLLSGPTNSGGQGLPVPLIYGRCRVGSVLASAGISVEDLRSSSDVPMVPGSALGVTGWGQT